LRHAGQGAYAASWRLAPRWAWTLLSLPIYLGGVLLAMAAAAGAAGAAMAASGAPPA